MQKIPYDSEEARRLATTLMKYINDIAINESMKIASETNVYPAWIGSEWEKKKTPIANSTLTCQAPTGTISMIADCSSGIEPIIALVHKRKNCVGKEFFIVHNLFEKALKEECTKQNKKYDDVIQKCYETGTIQDIDWLPNEFKSIFRSSMDIPWRDHLLMQAAFQKSVGNSISKTINAKKDIPIEDIREAIMMAWRLGCKGFTLYRMGSKANEVITLAENPPEDDGGAMEDYPDVRPDVLFGATYVSQSGCGKLYTVINYLNGRPYEVFVFSGGTGGCQAQNEGVGRLASLLLRNGVEYHKVVKQLKKVKCPVAMKNPHSQGKSCSDIIGSIIAMSMGDDTPPQDPPHEHQKPLSPRTREVIKPAAANIRGGKPCPDCGEPLEFGEGCNNGTCPNCGWSGCQ
jgi:ribonucleoside-diphosphate reductase alpha chain